MAKWSREGWRNTSFQGYSMGVHGGRVFGVTYRKKPVFRLDYKRNPSPSKLHVHYGNMNYHRPWYAPWKKY